MTTKQLTNAKNYIKRQQVGPERSLLELIGKYPELKQVILQPLHAPMLAKYADKLLKSCTQFYIDTTFNLLVANIYLTPLLAALPPSESSARHTAGPVVSIAFCLHENRAALDYKYFMGVLKEGGAQPLIIHRDFDDAIGKAISEVHRLCVFFSH